MAVERPVLLQQFARVPVAGQVKTRLIPALGAQLAADLHCSMLRHTLATLRDSGLGPVQLWLTGSGSERWLHNFDAATDINLQQQRGADLGQRMEAAISSGLADFGKVLLVGSDAPRIDASYLAQAADALDDADVVFGPALDGGYVLLGMRRMVNGWLDDIAWGTDCVLEQSSASASRSGLQYQLLEPLPDIDVPEDLRWLPKAMPCWQVDGAQAPGLASRLAELAAERA